MPRPKLSCPESSDTGAYKLSWGESGRDLYTVFETGPDNQRRVLYEGSDGATTVSGRTEGLYTYEAHGTSPGARSSCEVDVAPPSLALAFSLFAVGLLVTASTVALIIWGHRRHRRNEIG